MRRLIPLFSVAVLAVLALATTGVSLAEANSTSGPVTMAVPCTSNYASAPGGFTISCADANSEVTGLTWSDWGQSTAYATGEARWNGCTPTCVAGTWESAPITLWAWGFAGGHYEELASSSVLLPTTSLAPYPG